LGFLGEPKGEFMAVVPIGLCGHIQPPTLKTAFGNESDIFGSINSIFVIDQLESHFDPYSSLESNPSDLMPLRIREGRGFFPLPSKGFNQVSRTLDRLPGL
jgi:hypothetical protein